ncbi:conserved hypothetical protein [Desulfamplus magnetovallimortis]|uniref:Zinc finger/thioredoxin putative domain-containing protein n=1 Tax=Desulfamplus magnetovallimortis TaxID=1246637 RepID=A0A1W1HAI7_9BACT|nr:hypothetical protein [Desulfamplus magnetovallimortis]SLM29432.1 conserved hypothetical protein [Desulfamplus magnetovallimortis]
MITECPNCSQALRFSADHINKINAALERLPQGRTLKFGCPKCKKPIELDKEGRVVDKEISHASPSPIKSTNLHPHSPPAPPDISWLFKGEAKAKDIVKNIPTAMVMIPDESMKAIVINTLKGKEYQIITPANVDEAINSMRFTDYSIVVYHVAYENKILKLHDFHQFMQQMSMANRRTIFYILIGPEFKTLYDLEALTNSANLVINDNEVKYMPALLTRGLSDFEELFRPYISILKAHGKS